MAKIIRIANFGAMESGKDKRFPQLFEDHSPISSKNQCNSRAFQFRCYCPDYCLLLLPFLLVSCILADSGNRGTLGGTPVSPHNIGCITRSPCKSLGAINVVTTHYTTGQYIISESGRKEAKGLL